MLLMAMCSTSPAVRSCCNRPPRRPRPAGRARRAHRESGRLHPGQHRHRPLHGPDGPGHELVMSRPEYKNAPRVFVIVDNGSESPRPGRHQPPAQGAPQRDHDPHAGARILAQLGLLLHHPEESRHAAFTRRYNQAARPFNWKFTAADLAALLPPHQRTWPNHPAASRTSAGRLTTRAPGNRPSSPPSAGSEPAPLLVF
jgi:hypothetical protein